MRYPPNVISALRHIMARAVAFTLCALLGLIADIALPEISLTASKSALSTAWAQEEAADPLVAIESAIAEGKKQASLAMSRKKRGRSRGRVRARVKLYLKALKSFSAALRPVDSYYLEDENEALYQEVNTQMDEILNKPEVKAALSSKRAQLTKVLAKEDNEKAMELVQELISIDERDAKMKYLLPILSTQLP